MQLTKSRILSLLLAAGYVTATYALTDPPSAIVAGVQEIPGLLLIWFAQGFGDFVGQSGSGYIANPTPAIFIAILGWLALIGWPLITHFPPTFLLH